MRTIRLAAIVAFLLFPAAAPVWACGFIETANQITLREDAAKCDVLLFGRLQNAQKDDSKNGGSTELVITSVLKSDPVLGDQKIILVTRYLPIKDTNNPPTMLIFASKVNGKLVDFWRGHYTTQATVDYLKGLLALDARNRTQLLRYCFDYLDHADSFVADDAFAEFMKTRDDDLGRLGQKLPPKKLRAWLENADKLSPDRQRMCGYLLGNCGGDEDAKFLRTLIEAQVRKGRTFDGMLTGYVLLRPKEGWDYVCALLKDPSAGFPVRYAALRAARFFHNTRPDVINDKQILAGIDPMLDQADIADVAIEYLRRWKCWGLTERILALYRKPSHDLPIMKRSILRYALECPDEAAKKFVVERRKADAELVAETEELLQLETK